MLFFLGIIAVELIALYILSRRLTQNLFIAVYLLTKSRPVAVGALSLIFFPGTVVHELAHLFTAEILGVRTSGLTLVPEGIDQKEVRTGSVAIAQSDPIRRAIIGIAPIFVGLGALGTLSYFLPALWYQATQDAATGTLFTGYAVYTVILMVYALFAVSNTMFSSPEDLEGFWPVVGVLTLIAAAMYLTGIRITLTDETTAKTLIFFQSVAINIGYMIGCNIILFGISKVLIRGVERITKRRLVR